MYFFVPFDRWFRGQPPPDSYAFLRCWGVVPSINGVKPFGIIYINKALGSQSRGIISVWEYEDVLLCQTSVNVMGCCIRCLTMWWVVLLDVWECDGLYKTSENMMGCHIRRLRTCMNVCVYVFVLEGKPTVKIKTRWYCQSFYSKSSKLNDNNK